MKKHISLILILAVILSVLAISSALAAGDNLKISMALSNDKPAVGETIRVSISVTNNDDRTSPVPVKLFGPDYKRIHDFGEPQLEPGASVSWEGSWTVTQKQLEEGRITFTLKYGFYDEAGAVKQKVKHFSKKLLAQPAEEKADVSKDSSGILDNWDGYSLMGVVFPVKPGRAEDRRSFGAWTLHAQQTDIIDEFFSDGSMTMTIKSEGTDPVTYPGLYRIVANSIEMYIVRDDGRIESNTYEAGFDGIHLFIDGFELSGE